MMEECGGVVATRLLTLQDSSIACSFPSFNFNHHFCRCHLCHYN